MVIVKNRAAELAFPVRVASCITAISVLDAFLYAAIAATEGRWVATAFHAVGGLCGVFITNCVWHAASILKATGVPS